MIALNDCRGMPTNEIIQTILDSRGIDDLEHFLNPTEEDLLPMDGMGDIESAKIMIDSAKSIMIYADVDTDGVTSCAIMYRYLRNVLSDDIKIDTCINNGKQHGLKGQDTDKLLNYDLVIIVDSLDSNYHEYKWLDDNDVMVLVLDHHSIEDIPYNDYVTLISSQYKGYPNKELSGAGVVWKFVHWLDKQYGLNECSEFSSWDLIDLCSCGMSADMMDMSVPENRFLLEAGLNSLKNLAITKMKGTYPFNTNAINFSVAPMINSAVRMNENEDAMKVFLSDDNKEVLSHMRVLKKAKKDQDALVSSLIDDAIEQANSQLDNPFLFITIDTKFGINGLLANKLLEIYQRPIFVVKDYGDKYMGSMRAVGVDDFRQMCNDSGFAIANGHESASGIFINKEDLDNFFSYITEELSKLSDVSSELEIAADIHINVDDITTELIDMIKRLDKISGKGFPPIRVLVDDIYTYEVSDYSKKKHLVIKPDDRLQIIKWNWNGDWNDIEDSAIIGDGIQCIGTLNSGFIGRTFCNQLICDEIGVKDE